MTDLRALFDTMTPEQKAGAIQVLDLCTRPLTVREIENLLRLGGVSRARSIKLAGTLKHMAIIAVLEDKRHA